MRRFRFQDPEMWKDATEIGSELFDVADSPEAKKYTGLLNKCVARGCRFPALLPKGADQAQKKESHQFLSIARRSTFENAHILIMLEKRALITDD